MADRGKTLTELGAFADPKAMKDRYGIDISQEQVRLANKTLVYYRTVDDRTLAKMTDAEALRWPYQLTDTQRLDALMHTEKPDFTITQTVIWKELRPKLEKTAKDYPNIKAVIQAVRDIEGFMRLNLYLGDFKENRDILADRDHKLTALFAMAYKNHRDMV